MALSFVLTVAAPVGSWRVRFARPSDVGEERAEVPPYGDEEKAPQDRGAFSLCWSPLRPSLGVRSKVASNVETEVVKLLLKYDLHESPITGFISGNAG
jgi:hypothetical protein